MLTVALVFAGLAALVHVYIFWLEALAFDTVGRKAFGLSSEQAATVKQWAYNQGFYNVFLAIGTVAGLGLVGPNQDAGIALILLTTGSMVTAALILISSDPSKARGAVVQGTFPAICLLFLAIWVST